MKKKVLSFLMGPPNVPPNWPRRYASKGGNVKRDLELASLLLMYPYAEPCRLLVPDLVTTLTIPPSARPYSAPKLLFTTRNSLTASWDGVARCDPVARLM